MSDPSITAYAALDLARKNQQDIGDINRAVRQLIDMLTTPVTHQPPDVAAFLLAKLPPSDGDAEAGGPLVQKKDDSSSPMKKAAAVQALVTAVGAMIDAVEVLGRAGATNHRDVRCDVHGLCLGHWYDLYEAMTALRETGIIPTKAIPL